MIFLLLVEIVFLLVLPEAFEIGLVIEAG